LDDVRNASINNCACNDGTLRFINGTTGVALDTDTPTACVAVVIDGVDAPPPPPVAVLVDVVVAVDGIDAGLLTADIVDGMPMALACICK
jgi:hypothetical protein